MTTVRELLASLEHEQWMSWSKAIVKDELISGARRMRWAGLWRSYEELPEVEKESDRRYADMVLIAIYGKDAHEVGEMEV